MQLIKTLDVEGVKRRTIALAKAAKILDLPVVLTSSQEERAQGPLIPELAKLLPEAFEKRVRRAGIVNAWDDTNFVAAIEATGRNQLIMGGVTTDVCLIYPSISAGSLAAHRATASASSGAGGRGWSGASLFDRQRLHGRRAAVARFWQEKGDVGAHRCGSRRFPTAHPLSAQA